MSHPTSHFINSSEFNDIQSRFLSFDEFLTNLSSFLSDRSNLSDIVFRIRDESYSYSDMIEALCRIIKSDIALIESHVTKVAE